MSSQLSVAASSAPAEASAVTPGSLNAAVSFAKREESDAYDDEYEGEAVENRVRMIKVDKSLAARRDLSMQMTTAQMIKVKAFEAAQERKNFKKKLRWYIIDPQSTMMQCWDALTAIALIFTAIGTPLEVGFLPAPECPSETLFIVNRLVDSVFFFDMCLQFFLSHPVKMNVWETDIKKIAERYIGGWFLIDFGSLFPSIFDILPVLECGNGKNKKSPATALRVVRALRLLKLVRLLKTPFALVRRLIVRIATPRATVTVVSLLIECLCVAHLLACILGMITTFDQRLNSWLGTHGFCREATEADKLSKATEDLVGPDGAVCEEPAVLYLQCLWWSVGMLMGAPISMTPDKGPFPRHYFDPTKQVNLRSHEQILVIVMKCFTSFHWTTVIARFVFVFNNLDAETKSFQLGWDALNRFVSFFKIEQRMAMQLREFYLERNKEMRARSRRKVLNQFSPFLTEEIVWELDKKWLVKIPAFSLIADRGQGEELRFFVKAALSFDFEVFVPKDRPPPRRLYVIQTGTAMYKGEQLGFSDSWGSQDVFLKERPARQRIRAYALSYLHVMHISVEALEKLRADFPRAYLLARLWTILHAVGEYIVAEYRESLIVPVLLPPAELERRINAKKLTVVKNGRQSTETGEDLFSVVSKYVRQLASFDVVQAKGQKGVYVVIDRDQKATAEALAAVPPSPSLGGGGSHRGLPTADADGGADGGEGTGHQPTRLPSRGVIGQGTANGNAPVSSPDRFGGRGAVVAPAAELTSSSPVGTWNPLGKIFSNRERAATPPPNGHAGTRTDIKGPARDILSA